MGLNIGGVTGSLASLRSSPDFAQVRLGAQRDPVTLPGVRQADDDGRGPFFRRQGPPQIQVGFGRGLSPQGAALRTISATIENTRRTIPTIKEIRERFIIASSARRDQAQRVVTERTERTLTRRVESRIPEASAQARNFGGGLDEIRGQAQAPLEGAQAEAEAETAVATDVEADAAGPTNQINDEQFGFGASENEVRLDVRV